MGVQSLTVTVNVIITNDKIIIAACYIHAVAMPVRRMDICLRFTTRESLS